MRRRLAEQLSLELADDWVEVTLPDSRRLRYRYAAGAQGDTTASLRYQVFDERLGVWQLGYNSRTRQELFRLHLGRSARSYP